MNIHFFKIFSSISVACTCIFLAGSCGGNFGTPVMVDTVKIRTVKQTVTASGKVQPETEVAISSDVSGQIVNLRIAEGDSVKKGQLLLEIEPDIYISQSNKASALVSNAKAQVATAKARKKQAYAQMLQAKSVYELNKKLYDKQAISETEYNQIFTQYKVAKSDYNAAEKSVDAAVYSLQSTQASLQVAQNNLQRTKIYAPMDGIVSLLAVEEGEKIVGTAQMAGTELMRIANLNNMQVLVEVNENDIIKVKLYDTAQIDVDAYLDRKFLGVVTQIANSPTTSTGAIATNEVTNYEVEIRILPSSYQDLMKGPKKVVSPFRPGMSASVEVFTKQVDSAVTVPIIAVTVMKKKYGLASNKDSEFKYIVFKVSGDTVIAQPVKTGIQDRSHYVIKDGLKTGDVVVDYPYEAISEKLEEGDKIRITTKEQLYNSK